MLWEAKTFFFLIKEANRFQLGASNNDVCSDLQMLLLHSAARGQSRILEKPNT